MMAQISAKDLATDLGLAADDLSKPCDSNIITLLADCFSEWRVIFASLLSEIDLGDIDRENRTEEERRIAALRKWKARKGDEATYKGLVDALLNNGKKDKAESLCKSLVDHLSDKNDDDTTTTMTDCDATEESESIIKFQCPCGGCSLETYLQNGCPESCIPYLGMTTLSKGDQENLNYILKKDTKKIMKSFTNLSNRTCDSLERQGVPIEKLIRVATNFNSSLYDPFMKLKSINLVFAALAPEMSFFNHGILAYIIEELGDEDDKKRLNEYSQEFEKFCKRKVFEVEPGRCTCGQHLSQLKGRKLFAVVLPIDENTMLKKLGDAVNIKETLADVLGVPPATLHLHRIDRGSVILVFSVPDCIAEEVFPLQEEKITLLRVKGIVLFVPQDLKSESSQVEDVTKPFAYSTDIHEPSSKHIRTVPSDTPGELLVSHNLPTSAQLSWTPVPEDKQNDIIIGYTVQVMGPCFTEKRETPVMDANATSYEESDLKPYTTYTFSVSAMTKAGTGPAISISSTTPQGTPSGTPEWLTVRCSYPTLGQLAWGVVPVGQLNGIVTGYVVQIEGPDTTQNIPTNITSMKVYDLKPSTEYSFSVSAVTVAGSGPAISTSVIMPRGALSNTTGSFKTSQYHPTSALISWEALHKRNVTGYTVQVVGPDSTQVIPIDDNITSVEIYDLRASTQYTFIVSAVTAADTTYQRGET